MDKSTETWDDNHHQDHFSDEDERRVLYAALESFRQYRRTAHLNVTHRRRQNFYALPTTHWQMLSASPFSLLTTLDRVDEAIDANADIADRMVEAAKTTLGIDIESISSKPAGESGVWPGAVTTNHIDKARSTIRQLYRDWTSEGANEQKACYDPVLQDLELEFAKNHDNNDTRVLVPGAGLGRLVFEICRQGYNVEGNEISWHQLIASNWILNSIEKGETHDMYPFAAEFSNMISRDHQLRVVKVPDVHPGSALEEASDGSRIPCEARLNMAIGEFVGIYGENRYSSSFDAVVTVFFLDTAPNAIRYIETVRHCLKAGGIWANVGPLLWHFEDRAPIEKDADGVTRTPGERLRGIEESGSVELTNEEVLLLVEKMGFDIEKQEILADGVGYIHNVESMLQSTYRPAHWVARKRA